MATPAGPTPAALAPADHATAAPVVIEVAEGAEWQRCELSGRQVEILEQAKVMQTRHLRGGVCEIKAGKMIGCVRLGAGGESFEVRISPKLTIGRLLFLLGFVEKQKTWRWQDEEVPAAEKDDLLPAVAQVFARSAGRALSRGILRGYRAVEDSLPVLRGRLRESDQMRRRFGLALPVEVRYDEHTVDIVENQMVLAASRRLLTLPGVERSTIRALRQIVTSLAGVSALNASGPERSGAAGSAPPATRLNAHYQPALRLAELVLRSASFEREDGTLLRVDGLLVNMERVFEEFVVRAVGDVLERRGGRSRWHVPLHLADGERVKIEPDLVYYHPDEVDGRMKPAAVLDAKYILAPTQGANADALYQLLAYCTVLGLRTGRLVYAGSKKDGPGSDVVAYRVQGSSGIELIAHVLDLSTPIAELRQQVENLAEVMSPA